MRIDKPEALLGQAIDMRRRNLGFLVVAIEIAVPQVVCHNEHNINRPRVGHDRGAELRPKANAAAEDQ